MTKLNDIPNCLLNIFVRNHHSVIKLFEKINYGKDISQEVSIYIDCQLYFFYDSLKNCFLDENAFTDHNQTEEALHWQTRQVYRIINALLAFERKDVPFKSDLLSLKKELQENQYLKPLLEDIKNGKILPDITCSGEGVWREGDGYVNMRGIKTEIIFYVGPGMVLTDGPAWDIENFKFDPNKLTARNTVTNELIPYQSFINHYSYGKPLENFTLTCRADLKLRLVEAYTGEILATPKIIKLNDIIKSYPDRTLHWAACAVMFDKHHNPIGEFAGFSVYKKKSKNKKNPLGKLKTHVPTLFKNSIANEPPHRGFYEKINPASKTLLEYSY